MKICGSAESVLSGFQVPRSHVLVNTLPHPSSDQDDQEAALAALGKLWVNGVDIERPGTGRIVSLSPYPFARVPYLVDQVDQVAPDAHPGAVTSAVRAGRISAVGPQAPSVPTSHYDPLVAQVVDVFESILGVGDVGPHDSFAELGGDSLVATRAAAVLRSVLKVDFSARELFTHRTPHRIAATVAVRLQPAKGENR